MRKSCNNCPGDLCLWNVMVRDLIIVLIAADGRETHKLLANSKRESKVTVNADE